MIMHKTLLTVDDMDRLYIPRKEAGRGLVSIEDSVDTSIQDYIEKHERELIKAIRNDTDNTIDNRMTITRKHKWEGKQLHGRFKRIINNISYDKTWTGLRKGNFKRERESLLIAAQDNAVRTNHIKARRDKTQQNEMIGRCSLDNKHGRPGSHPANVGCSLFRYKNSDLRNHTNQRSKQKTWTREDNQLALHCYFRSNPTQRGYRKRMMEIWQELPNVQTTSQRLADQVRTIIKKGWFSELEIIEIHQKINDQEWCNNTLPGTSNINKQKQPIQNEPPTSENGKPTQPNNTQQNNLELTLTQ